MPKPALSPHQEALFELYPLAKRYSLRVGFIGIPDAKYQLYNAKDEAVGPAADDPRQLIEWIKEKEHG